MLYISVQKPQQNQQIYSNHILTEKPNLNQKALIFVIFEIIF